MKVGFDVSQTGQGKAGCGYFADSVIRTLATIDAENEYTLYPTFGDFYWDPAWPSMTCQIAQANFRRGLGHRTFEAAQSFWSSSFPELDERLGNPDIVHANNFFCPIGLQHARLVYTLYDLAFVEYPEWTTEANRVGCFDGVFNASLYADCIIAISQYSRRHFLATFPHYPADRIVVVPLASRFLPGANPARPRTLPQLQPQQFWLNTSTLEPRKNHVRLLRAYARLKASEGQTFPLVLTGAKGWLMDDFEKTIDDLGLRQEVVLLGYVDDAALQWLYQNCFAFVYPSLFEGFGLPVLEAMSLGAPVITSNTTSLPEIVGSAGILVDPLQEEELFSVMLKLSREEIQPEALQARAREKAKEFSWERTARQIKDLYREVVSRHRFVMETNVCPGQGRC
jgi:glycosyltransferase involved in cell wall biosynthesis